MLNNTATRPRPLQADESCDFSKVATFYRQRARCFEAASKAARGWVAKAYAADALRFRRAAVTADELHAHDVANPVY